MATTNRRKAATAAAAGKRPTAKARPAPASPRKAPAPPAAKAPAKSSPKASPTKVTSRAAKSPRPTPAKVPPRAAPDVASKPAEAHDADRRIPTIAEYMTPCPFTIGLDQSLAIAHEIMRARDIRHLPVLDDGKLVGIVSIRDLHLIETLQGVDADTVTVEEAMTPDPYAVSPETPLEEVARTMARHRYGSCIIVENEKVVGMFTTVDAMNALVVALHDGA